MAFDVTSYLLGRNSSGGGGGGNPNWVQKISGTAEDILTSNFTRDELQQLISDIHSGHASVILTVYADALGYGVFSSNVYVNLYTGGCDIDGAAYFIQWSVYSGEFLWAFFFDSGNKIDLSGYASVIPVDITIYHHPMPTIPE